MTEDRIKNAAELIACSVFALLICVSGVSARAQDQYGNEERHAPVPDNPQKITNIHAEQDRDQQTDPTIRNVPARLVYPSEPDLEFQEFVASSLGKRLPIFGQNLFENVPSTFAPLDRVPVTSDYTIGPGDELLIKAWGQIDMDYRATVDRTGSVYIPKVGSLSVAGLRYDQLHDFIATAIGRVFKNFELVVTLGQLRSIQVFLVGQVRRPGSYTVSSLSTLVNALFVSGGPSKRGSMRNIELNRNGKVITTFDLYDLIVRGDKSKDAPLLPGDVIYVPPVRRLVAMAGSINVPGILELKDQDTLADAISYAGGLTSTVAGEYAVLERIDAHKERKTDEVSLDDSGLTRRLQDGDVIRFLRISSKFENTITLRGNVAVPGRYPWHEGMRVRDLIPTRESLVTDEYWKKQNRLAADTEGQSFELRDDKQKVDSTQFRLEIRRNTAEINWDYAVIERLELQTLTTHLLPFNLGKAVEGDDSQNLPLESGDVVTIFSQADLQVPVGQRSIFVRLEGEFVSSGVYQVKPGDRLRDLAARVGGFTPQAYLYGAEFTREATREDQQRRLDEYIRTLEQNTERSASTTKGLGTAEENAAAQERLESQRRLLDKLRQLKSTGRIVLELKPTADSIDALPNLVLEDGDRLYIPFRPSTVNVVGAVYNANSFLFKPGKTVGDYLRLSGGITKDGDRKQVFVISADGSTMSRQGHHSLIWPVFESMRLMPGDTIVAPENLDKGAAIRGLKDYTVLVSSFALTAAAIASVLR